MAVDILILGAGWSSSFLLPLCTAHRLTHAATTRTGRGGTLKFVFDPDAESEDIEPYRVLPDAHTVLITFPIQKPGAAERLVRLYRWSRADGEAPGKEFETGFILLGTTGIWDGTRNTAPKPLGTPHNWYDRHSPLPAPTPRASAEIELLALSAPQTPTTVLNLAGLWGGPARSPRTWVGRVAPSKDALRQKGSLHLLHGHDLARAILAVHADFARAAGQRWLLTDGRVYDWWDLAGAWAAAAPPDRPSACASESTGQAGKDRDGKEGQEKAEEKEKEDPAPHAQWVRELMHEHAVRALPRDVAMLGRALDSREFWDVFGLSPVRALVGGSV